VNGEDRPGAPPEGSDETGRSWPGDSSTDSSSVDDDIGGSGWKPTDDPKPDPPGTGGSGSDSTPFAGLRPTVYGVARKVDVRREPHRVAGQDILVVSFRVHEFDDEGNLTRETPVELRGGSITGGVREGDEVGLDGGWRDGVFRTNAVTIYKNGQVGGFARATSAVAWWQIAVAVLMVLAFIAFVIWGVRRINDSGPPASAAGTQPTTVPTIPITTSETETTTTEESTTTETTTTTPEAAVLECAPDADTGTTTPQLGDDVTVLTGKDVRWVNTSSEEMFLGLTNAPSDFSSTTLQPGDEFSYAFTDAGTYPYQCVFTTVKVIGNVMVEAS
jgi:plastocyanin